MTDMNAATARSVIERVLRNVDELIHHIRSLHDGRAWLALGHASWDELVETELRPHLALTKADREVVMSELTAAGMSTRDVAKIVEVHRSTVGRRAGANAPDAVRRSGLGAPRKRTDASGRSQPIHKATAAEAHRRDQLIVAHYRAGHSTREISEAMGVGLSTVCNQLRKHGVSDARRHVGMGPIADPGAWRDEDIPAPAQPPRWRTSRIVGMAQMLNEEYREGNFANVLANQASEAEAAGDHDWLIQALASINAAMEKLERGRRILTDDAFRDTCRDLPYEGAGSPGQRRPLRAV